MLIWELKHNLTPRLQDCLNFGVELLTSISALAKHYLAIYEQMQATDRIRNRTKPLESIQNSAPTYLITKTYEVLVTNSCTNTSFSRLLSFIIGTKTPMPRRSEEK